MLPAKKSASYPLTVAKELEKDGVGMGVLSDGCAYVTGKGLARMCGVADNAIREMVSDWPAEQLRPRGKIIAEILQRRGFKGTSLFVPVEVNGSTHHAYPKVVCGALLEYYAFVVSPPKQHALDNARKLMETSFRAFVYVQIGYDPRSTVEDAWQQFHDRVSLVYNRIPPGYFCVFKETADMVLAMIQEGVPVNDKTVPDISVGQMWSAYWVSENLVNTCGERIRYEHYYPDYFPQARSNPQTPYAYSDAALPVFRKWMRESYLHYHFPTYIARQVKSKALPPITGQLAILAVIDSGENLPNSRRLPNSTK